MEIKRFTTPSCCGKTALIFKLGQMIDKSLCDALIPLNFTIRDDFYKAGILYMTSDDLIITGPFGSNKLQVKCKKSDCSRHIDSFETLLTTLV